MAKKAKEAREFVALKNFKSDDGSSQYVKGLTYTIFPDNTKLSKLASEWESEGKIEFTDNPVSAERVAGTGTVD